MANQQVTKQSQNGLKRFNAMLENTRTQEYLSSVLGEKKQTFVGNMVALVANSKMLMDCDPSTVMFSCLKSAALDLSLDPVLGLSYVIPFRDNKNNTTVATWQLGSKGYVQLALRSAQFRKLNVRDVREGEIVDEDFVSGEMRFKRLQKDRESAPIVGYVAYMQLVNGFEKQLYMSVEELESHAKRFSQTYRRGYGPWADQYMKSQMMEKTVLKRLLSKYAPLSVEMRDAIRSDFAVLGENDSVRYIDNEESAIDFDKTQQVAEQFADFDEIVNGEESEKDDNTASDK